MANASISGFKKARYYSSVSGLYLLTLLFACLVFKPPDLFAQKPVVAAITPVVVSQAVTLKPIISGRPIRIVIASVGIDLPVDIGYYNEADGSWSLSGYHAQFAMLSNLSNNTTGNTFIYGHNNRFVFGPIKNITAGAQALVYTDNNHVFSYIFQSTNGVTPNDTSVLSYQGPPIMTVQTCSGVWNEVRQMYVFKYGGTIQ